MFPEHLHFKMLTLSTLYVIHKHKNEHHIYVSNYALCLVLQNYICSLAITHKDGRLQVTSDVYKLCFFEKQRAQQFSN